MKNVRKLFFPVVIISGILLLSLIPVENSLKASFSLEEIQHIHSAMLMTVDSSQYFPTQVDCGSCHGTDLDGFALVDANGTDVNMQDAWQTSMMALSAKDPFWRAKVSHEVLVNPSHSADLQDKCTSCHAPMGHYTSKYQGHEHYLMSDLLIDTVGLDGVSCGACHQMSADNLGSIFSGKINYDTSRIQYGPYESPFAPPMTSFVGFTPIESEHINDAGICASCHTLVTQSVDLNGEYTGESYVEQATYHEWLNSVYDDEGDNPTTCQGCHMPQIADSVVISDNYLFLQKRFPYGLHDLVGANTMMLQLMKDNKIELGIDAPDENFDETIFKTYNILQGSTLDMELELESLDTDSAYFRIDLTNKAGHKFPSGYPSRRAFIEFIALTETGDTLFKSGVLDDSYEVEGQDAVYEPHYEVINNSEQVQIYELVIGDLNSNFSTVLERAYASLKDNRLTPIGFSTEHEVYDTTLIVGNALTDANFNKDENGNQGTGGDIIRYHIPLNGYTGLVDVKAKVWYQSLPPKWMAEMFAESTPEIESFRGMYDEADKSPVLVKSAQLNDIFVESTSTIQVSPQELGLSPNPTIDGFVYLDGSDEIESLTIYNLNGQLLKFVERPGNQFELPATKGLYFVKLNLKNRGQVVVKLMRG